MLYSTPTKKGTGISIFGDYYDLKSLYETVHHFTDSLSEENENQKGQSQLLMNFAYEIRKAYSGQRLTKTIEMNEVKNTYYGCNLVWTDILLFINTLRHNAGYIQSEKAHQGILYTLEGIIDSAMMDYDPVGANMIQNHVTNRINITDKLVFLIYQSMHNDFITSDSGKERFRNIPLLFLQYFNEKSKERTLFIKSLQDSAKKFNCEILDLEIGGEDEIEIKW